MNSAEHEVNQKRQFWGLLLVPCLVFSNVLIALNWEIDDITCSSDGDFTASGSITLEGVEYDVYTFSYDALDSGGNYRSGDGECELSDWDVRTADEIDLLIRIGGYNARDACSLEGDSECDGAVDQDDTRWIPMG